MKNALLSGQTVVSSAEPGLIRRSASKSLAKEVLGLHGVLLQFNCRSYHLDFKHKIICFVCAGAQMVLMEN